MSPRHRRTKRIPACAAHHDAASRCLGRRDLVGGRPSGRSGQPRRSRERCPGNPRLRSPGRPRHPWFRGRAHPFRASGRSIGAGSSSRARRHGRGGALAVAAARRCRGGSSARGGTPTDGPTARPRALDAVHAARCISTRSTCTPRGSTAPRSRPPESPGTRPIPSAEGSSATPPESRRVSCSSAPWS